MNIFPRKQLVVFLFLYSASLFALDCKDIRSLTKLYLRSHMTVNSFDHEISERTLKNFIKNWDIGKVYFLKKDVDYFLKKYKSSLPAMIEKGDCAAIDEIFASFVRKHGALQKDIERFINTKHNFNMTEYLVLDRKTYDYASDDIKLKQRWRKRVKFQYKQLFETLDKDAEVRKKLTKRYELLSKKINETNSNEVYQTFIASFATALDPHSDYLSPSRLEEFYIHTRLYLEGIGALLRSEEGITTIHSLIAGGSAQKSGIVKKGDKIVAVAQGDGEIVDVIDMDLQEVVKLIRGPKGSKVKLTIRREGKTFIATLTRAKIELPDDATKSKIYNIKTMMKKKGADPLKSYKIGVIDLPSFYRDFEARSAKQKDFRSSAKDVQTELSKLKKENVDLVIVDIRSNGGGALEEAKDLSALFVGSGPVVQVKKAQGKPEVGTSTGEIFYKGPLIVMVSQYSASSSEIFAGAIQDYERGLIIGGEHTFGKGSVQIIDNLSKSLGAMQVTIAKFYRPSGGSTQNRGVMSDIVLPNIQSLYDIGEKHYDYALPWNEVGPVPYKNFKMTKPYVKELQKRSAKRVKTDSEYKELFKAMDEYKKNKEDRDRLSLKIEKKDKKKKEEEKKEEDEDTYSKEVKLIDDMHLQEALRIAGDYVRLMNKESAMDFTLLELEQQKKEAKEAEEKKKREKNQQAAAKKKQDLINNKQKTENVQKKK